MSILVVVPVYNERDSISEVAKELLKSGFEDILIVNDGSEDGTERVVLEMGFNMTSHPINMGLGAGLQTGFKYAIAKKYNYVITFDGDGQMYVGDAVKVYEKAKEGYGFVYGCRNFNVPDVPKIRKYTNLLADALTALLSGKFVRDTQSGLRCIKVDLLKKFNLKSRGYSISSELVIESIKNGVLPKPVKINAIYTKESLKKGQKISNSFRVAKELLG
ncbi:glycosyltransferase family 2 protein [Patescibacteria group bacterium]|nr:glycosyltransferase family 2 protein [Patescibacteria group bacterium]